LPGSSFFSSAESFAMIRGGHVDLSILGAMEVSERGDIANWTVPGKTVKGIGGAMDLVAGARRVQVVMEHTSRTGQPKIRRECALPLTGVACVDMVITNLCVFAVRRGEGMTLVELAPGVSASQVADETEARYSLAPTLLRAPTLA
jgi:3-oxoacid CoA-transferase B subunit